MRKEGRRKYEGREIERREDTGGDKNPIKLDLKGECVAYSKILYMLLHKVVSRHHDDRSAHGVKVRLHQIIWLLLHTVRCLEYNVPGIRGRMWGGDEDIIIEKWAK